MQQLRSFPHAIELVCVADEVGIMGIHESLVYPNLAQPNRYISWNSHVRLNEVRPCSFCRYFWKVTWMRAHIPCDFKMKMCFSWKKIRKYSRLRVSRTRLSGIFAKVQQNRPVHSSSTYAKSTVVCFWKIFNNFVPPVAEPSHGSSPDGQYQNEHQSAQHVVQGGYDHLLWRQENRGACLSTPPEVQHRPSQQ